MLLRLLEVVEKLVLGGGAKAQLVDHCFYGRQVRLLRYGVLSEALCSGIEMRNVDHRRNEFTVLEVVQRVLWRLSCDGDQALSKALEVFDSAWDPLLFSSAIATRVAIEQVVRSRPILDQVKRGTREIWVARKGCPQPFKNRAAVSQTSMRHPTELLDQSFSWISQNRENMSPI